MPRFNRLLITGAAGNLGRELRKGLAPLASTLRLTDRDEMSPAGPGEETVVADERAERAPVLLVEAVPIVLEQPGHRLAPHLRRRSRSRGHPFTLPHQKPLPARLFR